MRHTWSTFRHIVFKFNCFFFLFFLFYKCEPFNYSFLLEYLCSFASHVSLTTMERDGTNENIFIVSSNIYIFVFQLQTKSHPVHVARVTRSILESQNAATLDIVLNSTTTIICVNLLLSTIQELLSRRDGEIPSSQLRAPRTTRQSK